MWYDAIKSVDSNHLITMGNGDVKGVFTYDPAIMKLDFNCHHIYPYWYLKPFNGYSRQKALDVFYAQLYWANKANPMPWVMGETGAIAWTAPGQDAFAQNTNNNSYTYTAHPLLVGTNLSQPPYGNVWGNFAHQDTFARNTQQAVLNYGGSGYAWWEFQDEVKPRPYSDTVPPIGNFIGLLKPGNPNGTSPPYIYTDSLDKPLVSGAFKNNTPTTPNAPGNMPLNYYNPFQGQYFTYSGRVVDQDGHPIKDAVVYGANDWYHDKPKELWHANSSAKYKLPREAAFDIFTFTREDGTFDLVSPVQRTTDSFDVGYTTYDYGRFDVVRVGAPAASNYWWNTLGDGGAPSDTLIVLYRYPAVFDDTVKNITLNAPANQTYTARHILVTQNIVIDSGATADFHASTEVELLPGFEAKAGSNVPVYIAPVQFNCGTLNNGVGWVFKTDEAATEQAPMNKNIEVHYSLQIPSVRLVPNPASNTVYLETDKGGSCYVEINSITGSNVYRSSFYVVKQSTVDVSSLTPGTYSVLVKLNGQTEIFKLIINR